MSHEQAREVEVTQADRDAAEALSLNEVGWLIEWPQKGGQNARWWCGGYGWEYATDRAVRFCRKEDAERVINTIICGDPRQPDVVFDCIIATDHEWMKP